MDPGPLGTLGVGMPFALATQLAHPEKRVLIIYGDGSFGFNGMEYDTAVRFNLPIVGIVGNDATLRSQATSSPLSSHLATTSRKSYPELALALQRYAYKAAQSDG